MDKLLRLLEPVKIKLTIERCFNYLLLVLSIGLVLCAVSLAVSKFVFIENIGTMMVFIVGASIITGLVYTVIRRPDVTDAAKAYDGLGFKERFTTAIELKDNASPVAELVIQDAIVTAERNDFRKLYKIRLHRRKLSVLAASLVLVLVCGFLPSPAREELAAQKDLQEQINEQIKELSAEEAILLANANAKQAKEIKQVISQLNKELKASKTESDAIKASKKAQEQLMTLSKDSVNSDLKQLGQTLKEAESTQAIGEAIESGDFTEINKSMTDLREQLQNASEEELKAIADAISDYAKEIEDNEELSESLNELIEALESGDLEDIEESVSALNESLYKLAQENSELRKALEKYNQSLSKTANQSQSQQSGEQGQQSGEQGQQSGEQGQQSGEQGQQSGEQGQQSGEQGQQNGQQGQEGQGESEGNGNSQGENSGQGDSGGQGQGKGHIEDESIYSRPVSGKSDDAFNITGAESAEGQNTSQDIKQIGEAGESVPYSQVYGEYKSEALNSLEDYAIPYGLKEIVKEYFSSLE